MKDVAVEIMDLLFGFTFWQFQRVQNLIPPVPTRYHFCIYKEHWLSENDSDNNRMKIYPRAGSFTQMVVRQAIFILSF